jgi:hypothetical protein
MLYLILASMMSYQAAKLDKASFNLLTEKPVAIFTSKKLDIVPEAPVIKMPQGNINRWRYRGQSGC